jgi:hypothetical protein
VNGRMSISATRRPLASSSPLEDVDGSRTLGLRSALRTKLVVNHLTEVVSHLTEVVSHLTEVVDHQTALVDHLTEVVDHLTALVDPQVDSDELKQSGNSIIKIYLLKILNLLY